MTYFPDCEWREIESLQKDETDFYFELQPGYCDTCKEIISKPVLRLNGTEKKYIGICRECKNKMKDVQLREIECPRCKKINWTERFIGIWD